MNNNGESTNKFTWNDTVTIKTSAPRKFHPGDTGVICTISEITSQPTAKEFCTIVGDWIYTVEFANGSDIQVAECYLKKYTASDSSD